MKARRAQGQKKKKNREVILAVPVAQKSGARNTIRELVGK
jgi:hypothetical protein